MIIIGVVIHVWTVLAFVDVGFAFGCFVLGAVKEHGE